MNRNSRLTRTSSWAGEPQRGVRPHALAQRGHSQKLPLVNAEFGDVFICFHILRCPLLDSRPWVKVEHLRIKIRVDLKRYRFQSTNVYLLILL